MAPRMRLRFWRLGCANRPFYRLVAIYSKRGPTSARFHQQLGTYNPIPDRHGQKHVRIDIDSVKRWIGRGADPSKAVVRVLSKFDVFPPRPAPLQIGRLGGPRPIPEWWNVNKKPVEKPYRPYTITVSGGMKPAEPAAESKKEEAQKT